VGVALLMVQVQVMAVVLAPSSVVSIAVVRRYNLAYQIKTFASCQIISFGVLLHLWLYSS
jgi:hypothetical protein